MVCLEQVLQHPQGLDAFKSYTIHCNHTHATRIVFNGGCCVHRVTKMGMLGEFE